MNTVLIREIHTPTAIHFVLKDTRTGVSKTWIPPKKLPEDQYEQVLEFVAQQFAEENSHLPPIETPSTNTPEVPFSEMTVAQFGTYMMQRKTIRIAEYTRDNWQSCLTNRIYPAMGTRLIRTITPVDIEDFLWRLQAEGLCHSTVMKYFSLLKVLFRQAYRCEALDRNPMDRVEHPQPRKDEMVDVTPSCYTADTIRYIIECADREPLRWRSYLLLMADTGIRRGECCALRWEDLDWENCTITVDSNVGYTSNKGVYVTSTKTSRSRVLDVDPDIMDLLAQMLAEARSACKGAEEEISPYLFPHRRDPSKPMIPSSATAYFRRFGERYGVDNFHPHALRHSYASVAITSGADIASISECLGHSDKAFTLRVYTTSNLDSKRKANKIRRNAISAAK